MRRAQLSAVLSPHGISVVSYKLARSGFDLTRVGSASGPLLDVEDAAQRLANLISAHGIGGGDLTVLVHGLASNYERLTLPAAPAPLLGIVVQREMLRLSGIPDGVVAYMVNEQAAASTGAKQEVWGGVLGSRMRDLLIEHLAAVNVRLKHVAVLPSVLSTMYTRLGSGPAAGAVMVCLPEGPVAGFVHAGKLRLILESPLGESDEEGYAAVCAEQLGRGALFLRQQFRGAEPTTLLLAAPAQSWDEIATELRANHDVEVTPLGDPKEPMPSLLALGAAMDATVHPEMNLARGGIQKRAPRGPSLQKIVAASQALVVIATIFALVQLVRLTRAENALKARDDAAWQYQRAFTTMVSTARARASEERNIDALEAVLQENGSLQTVLSALAAAAPRSIELDSVEIVRRSGTWDAIVVGHTTAGTNAESVRVLSRFHRSLVSQPALSNARVEDFSYINAADAAPGLRFKVTFASQPGS